MLICPTCLRESDGDFAFCPRCGASLAPSPQRERRKTVTIVFCDVIGSTSLGESIDPEALRGLLARYFDRMKEIVERHGGTVEKFIGDAVMAAFGVPLAHEDDALRAARAALEMRDAIPDLGLQARIGLNTGEVVTGTEERLVTGDAVNVAARLEQAAQPGEVLMGATTLALVRDGAEVEPVEALVVKGKAGPVAPYRLIRILQPPDRRHETPFVGRHRELAVISDAWQRVLAEDRCELLTILGDAGIGKSRLVEESVASIDAIVVRGRCLPYGEGITYWPVIEVLAQLDVLPEDETAANSIRSLLGQREAPTSAEEIAWAFRKTLERAARDRPLLVLFDDVQWGEETFLDLIEHVALLSAGAPILMLCIARPEFEQRRPAWSAALPVGPLDDDQVDELIPTVVSGEVRHRIARAAGGNPLFIGELLAMTGGAGGEFIVPATLRALLEARLDQLDPAERGVLERGAIEGEIFHRGAAQALGPEEDRLTARLAALVRKGLIRPERPQLPGEDAFRFGHLLIRDTAYGSMPKATRADLHRRLASWLKGRQRADLAERDELVGYHLERAHGYRVELGLPEDEQLTAAARGHLSAAGLRASARGDYRAAVTLLKRAVALIPPGHVDLSIEAELGDAMLWAGRGEEALRCADSLAERASAAGDRVSELSGRIKGALFRMFSAPEGATEKVLILVDQALPQLQDTGNDIALYVAYQALGWATFTHSHMDAALEAYERAAVHGRRAGLPHELLGWRAIFRFYGTTPASALLRWLDEPEQRGRWDHWLQATRGGALAMLGRIDEGRAILADTRAELAERGGGLELATITGIESVNVELLSGELAVAAELGFQACRQLEEMNERGFLSTAAATLADVLYEMDRLVEAEDWAVRAAELGASDDVPTQMLWRQVRARVLARRNGHHEAERLAREAIAIGEATDDINAQAVAYVALAEVLRLAGRVGEEAEALEQARARFERKENVVMAGRMRGRLAMLREQAPS
jgi:class 3 adenylate cyclase/tetratricopeptide (TPR) repeat protein